MSRFTERTRGITLMVLPKHLNGGPNDFLHYALGMGYDGKAYVICTEGVGWEITDEGFKFNDYRPNEKAWSVPELLAEVHESEEQTEMVDLADWVREFGARLESNFWLWHHTLSK